MLFCKNDPGNSGQISWDVRFCSSVAPFQSKFNLRGICSVMFVHFLQKYRCVPKIGCSADISIDILIDISIDILTDIFIDILTDREEGGGRRKEGVDFSLKSNNPTPTGGEIAKPRCLFHVFF